MIAVSRLSCANTELNYIDTIRAEQIPPWNGFSFTLSLLTWTYLPPLGVYLNFARIL